MTDPINPAIKISPGITGIKAGLITFVALVIYFFLMKAIGFMDSTVAWAINFVILGTGIVRAFEYYRSRTTLNVEYIPGLILGIVTTAAAVFPFAVFVYFFFSRTDDELLLSLKDNVLFMGDQITPTRAAFATAIEGICSGVVITFIIMQYFRNGFRRKRNEKRMHG
jgi:hypothetical protein